MSLTLQTHNQSLQILQVYTSQYNPTILPYTMPAIVTEVSAKFVATMILRVFGGVRWNTFS